MGRLAMLLVVIVGNFGLPANADEPDLEKLRAKCVDTAALVYGPAGTKEPAPLAGALVLDKGKRLLLAPSTYVPDAPTVLFPAYTSKGELRSKPADYAELWTKGERWAGKVVHRDKNRDLTVIELDRALPERTQPAEFAGRSVPIGATAYALVHLFPDRDSAWGLVDGKVRAVGKERMLRTGPLPDWAEQDAKVTVATFLPRGPDPAFGLFDRAGRVVGFPLPVPDNKVVSHWLDVREVRAFLTQKEVPFKSARDDALVGEWVCVKSLRGGQDSTPPPGSTITFMADGRAIIRDGKRAKDEVGSYSIDPKKNPPEIDIQPPDKSLPPFRGIYKVEKDTLVICVTMKGERPKQFESPDDSDVRLLTHERVKKKE